MWQVELCMAKAKPNIYIAAPLFNDVEKQRNRFLKNNLENWFDVFLPQDDGALLVDLIAQGCSANDAAALIFNGDILAMNKADILLSILDGAVIDAGVAMEIGYCYAKGKVCIGLQTDVRRQLPTGNNPMIDGALREIFYTEKDLFDYLKENYL